MFFSIGKKTSEQSSLCSDVVRLAGVEPARPYGHKHLKLASLPIPAWPRRQSFEKIACILYFPPVQMSTGLSGFPTFFQNSCQRGETIVCQRRHQVIEYF